MTAAWSNFVTLLGESTPSPDQIEQAGNTLRIGITEDPGQSLIPLFQQLLEQPPPTTRPQELAWRQILQIIDHFLSQEQGWQPSYLKPLLSLYQFLGANSNIRHQLLHICTSIGDSDCLAAITDVLCTDPPASSTTVGVVMAPLFQGRDLSYDTLFPRLFDTLEHPSVAAATLDLANHLVRKERFSCHPATDHLESLQLLLRDLNRRMEQLAEHPDNSGEDAQQTSLMISESIALMIALCDTLALIGQVSSVASLRQTLDLPHRRLQVESASALAKLGETIGTETLVALAAEPIVRLHVLAYAEELNVTEQIEPTHRTDLARAEGQLALWIAQDQQMGIAPNEMECVDQRVQFWPGYDQPLTCFLIRYRFLFGDSIYSNLGIVGPVTHSVTADLETLAIEDAYALFAGWHAEHEDIYERDVAHLDAAQLMDVQRFQRSLHDQAYQQIEPSIWGSFLGDPVLAATAVKNGIPGTVVTDFKDIYWHPRSESPRPLTTDDVYNVYKGRKLLKTFNQ